jgi:cell wall-associated NlpC family hydrolase
MKYFLFSVFFLFFSCSSTYSAYRNTRSDKVSSKKKAEKPEKSIDTKNSFINSWLGVPYKYGGNNKKGIDCSAFTQIFYKKVENKLIPRTALEQYRASFPISKRNMNAGDLIFFDINFSGKIDHVGIYLGKNQFLHASISKGVTISLLSEKYYRKRFVEIRRIK